MTEAPGRTLEDRVAAIEQALAAPALDFPERWTDEQAAEFRDKFDGLARLTALPGVRLLPPAPVLTTEAATALLRECVTVVKPGETLVIRSRDWTPHQAEMYQEFLDARHAAGGLPFRVVVVIGDEVAVTPPEPAEAFAARVKAIVHEDLRQASRLHGGDVRTSLPG